MHRSLVYNEGAITKRMNDMQETMRHTVSGNKIAIEMLTNRFTQDLVSVIKNNYPFKMLFEYNEIEFNLRQIKMIDSSSIGFLFDLHNKIQANNPSAKLIITVGDNKDLKELLHKFQVDLLLNVQ